MRLTIPATKDICLGLAQRQARLVEIQKEMALILSICTQLAGDERPAKLVSIGENTVTVEVPDGDS